MTIDRDALEKSAEEKLRAIGAIHEAKSTDVVKGAWVNAPLTVVLDAILPEVQAQALEDFADTLGVDADDTDSDELRGYRNGQRQALRKAVQRAAEYRKVASE